MPESVARTITPIVTRRTVVTTVARASFWKRVTASPFYAAAAFGHCGYPPCHGPFDAPRHRRRRAPGRRLRLDPGRAPGGLLGSAVGRGRPVHGERHPGHRELAPGPRAEPVRVLVPRPQDEHPGRLARPHGI